MLPPLSVSQDVEAFKTMKFPAEKILLSIILTLFASSFIGSQACTSALVSRGASASGRTLLWKHRDTGAASNFIGKVEATDSTMAFIGLFNGSDTRLREAWAGVNDAGFAIINTATYNMQPEKEFKDQEGIVMRRALEVCRTVEDFDSLLRNWPSPKGIQATFGVTDAKGECAYYEADDERVFPYPLAGDYAIRTNFAFAGGLEKRYGQERFDDAEHLLAEEFSKTGKLTAATFSDSLSRSFWSAPEGRDLLAGKEATAPDNSSVIPRRSSRASVVIEGPGTDGSPARMYVSLGFPAVAEVYEATLDSIPACLLPDPATGIAPAFAQTEALAAKCFVNKGGKRHFNLRAIRSIFARKKK